MINLNDICVENYLMCQETINESFLIEQEIFKDCSNYTTVSEGVVESVANFISTVVHKIFEIIKKAISFLFSIPRRIKDFFFKRDQGGSVSATIDNDMKELSKSSQEIDDKAISNAMKSLINKYGKKKVSKAIQKYDNKKLITALRDKKNNFVDYIIKIFPDLQPHFDVDLFTTIENFSEYIGVFMEFEESIPKTIDNLSDVKFVEGLVNKFSSKIDDFSLDKFIVKKDIILNDKLIADIDLEHPDNIFYYLDNTIKGIKQVMSAIAEEFKKSESKAIKKIQDENSDNNTDAIKNAKMYYSNAQSMISKYTSNICSATQSITKLLIRVCGTIEKTKREAYFLLLRDIDKYLSGNGAKLSNGKYSSEYENRFVHSYNMPYDTDIEEDFE